MNWTEDPTFLQRGRQFLGLTQALEQAASEESTVEGEALR